MFFDTARLINTQKMKQVVQQDHKLLLALGVSCRRISPNPLPTRLADDNDASDPSDRPGGPADPGQVSDV